MCIRDRRRVHGANIFYEPGSFAQLISSGERKIQITYETKERELVAIDSHHRFSKENAASIQNRVSALRKMSERYNDQKNFLISLIKINIFPALQDASNLIKNATKHLFSEDFRVKQALIGLELTFSGKNFGYYLHILNDSSHDLGVSLFYPSSNNSNLSHALASTVQSMLKPKVKFHIYTDWPRHSLLSDQVELTTYLWMKLVCDRKVEANDAILLLSYFVSPYIESV
eukprot:TRINITY_DN9522_c0_g1_i1.p1 TRINITY_DN9522_c0_g1~~TRINITY_DN9522_c0_g1_i1.p1  ORF type:complete len:229 (+),score=27.13 TRINITY_DN9522_c0_g1_i1:64-750(+)